MEIRRSVTELREHLQRLLRSPSDELDRTGRFLVYQIRRWWFCGRKLVKDRLLVTASALSYKTLLSLIPVLVVLFLIANTLIRDEQRQGEFQKYVLAKINIPAEQEYKEQIEEYISGVVLGAVSTEGAAGARAPVTIVSILVFIFVGTSVFSTVEGAFNYIWEVRRARSWLVQLWYFMTTILIVAALLGLGIYGRIKYDALFFTDQDGSWLSPAVSRIIPLVTAWVILYFFYKMMPNVQVQNRAALTAALISGTLWELGGKLGFEMYLKYATGAAKLYGNLALIPVFLLWIWISWVIILFGAELAYVIQHMRALARDQMEQEAHRRFVRADLVAVGIASLVGRRFSRGDQPPSRSELSNALGMPEADVDEVAEAMQQHGLLRLAGANRLDGGYVPARPLEQITMADVAAAGESTQLASHVVGDHGAVLQWARKYMEDVSQSTMSALREETLASLVRRAEAAVLGKPGDSRQ